MDPEIPSAQGDPLREMEPFLLTSGLRIALILVTAFFAVRLGRSLVLRLERKLLHEADDDIETQKRVRTLVGLFRTTALTLVVSVASLTILAELKVNLGPVIAAAGIGGLAIGFGAQTLVKDWISGFFLLLEDQLRVGDVVRINNAVEGVVEALTLRYVRLRDPGGVVHFITNGHITQVSNVTKEFSCFQFSFNLHHKQDPEAAMSALREAGVAMRAEAPWSDFMLEDPELHGIDGFVDGGYTVRGRIKTEPNRQVQVGREFNRRVKRLLDERHLQLSTPRSHVFVERRGRPGSGEIRRGE